MRREDEAVLVGRRKMLPFTGKAGLEIGLIYREPCSVPVGTAVGPSCAAVSVALGREAKGGKKIMS